MSVPETQNLHLKKPDYTNAADVFDMNDNMDILDQVIPDIWKTIYPVGAIYMSTVSTSPATLFGGGTWVQIKDRFLLSAGDTYTAGSTGGAATKSYTPAGTVGSHTLTVNEIPSHAHGLNSHTHSVGAHSHGLNNHVHSIGAHSHGLNGHTHSIGAHNHGLNGHTHSLPNHSHDVVNGAGNGFATFDTSVDRQQTGVGFQTGGTYFAGYSATTSSVGGTTGAANGNTANSAAFNSGGPSTSSTANSTAFNSGQATGSTANSTAFNTGGPSTSNTANAGGGNGHNHGFTGTAASINVMPPYLTVYMWRRTA